MEMDAVKIKVQHFKEHTMFIFVRLDSYLAARYFYSMGRIIDSIKAISFSSNPYFL